MQENQPGGLPEAGRCRRGAGGRFERGFDAREWRPPHLGRASMGAETHRESRGGMGKLPVKTGMRGREVRPSSSKAMFRATPVSVPKASSAVGQQRHRAARHVGPSSRKHEQGRTSMRPRPSSISIDIVAFHKGEGRCRRVGRGRPSSRTDCETVRIEGARSSRHHSSGRRRAGERGVGSWRRTTQVRANIFSSSRCPLLHRRQLERSVESARALSAMDFTEYVPPPAPPPPQSVANRFVSTTVLDTARATRAEEWKAMHEKLGQEAPPLPPVDGEDGAEPYDGRSLWEKLQVNKVGLPSGIRPR